MQHVSFVILHYLSYETTKKCVDSILQNIEYPKYDIIVVDNHSKNNSGQKLCEAYRSNERVTVIINQENLGFAKGNNIGYAHALKKSHADFVICTNNDTVFEQRDFISVLLECYEQTNAALIGPDIITLSNEHQSPYREKILTYNEAKRWYQKRFLYTCYLKMDAKLHIGRCFWGLKKKYEKNDAIKKESRNHKTMQKNVVLQGACVIFTPIFKEQFTYAFYPETYMYCEEDIIAYLCIKKGMTTCYTPKLIVQHEERAATKLLCKEELAKEIFLSENITKSLKVLLRLMKEEMTISREK